MLTLPRGGTFQNAFLNNKHRTKVSKKDWSSLWIEPSRPSLSALYLIQYKLIYMALSLLGLLVAFPLLGSLSFGSMPVNGPSLERLSGSA